MSQNINARIKIPLVWSNIAWCGNNYSLAYLWFLYNTTDDWGIENMNNKKNNKINITVLV